MSLMTCRPLKAPSLPLSIIHEHIIPSNGTRAFWLRVFPQVLDLLWFKDFLYLCWKITVSNIEIDGATRQYYLMQSTLKLIAPNKMNCCWFSPDEVCFWQDALINVWEVWTLCTVITQRLSSFQTLGTQSILNYVVLFWWPVK